MFSRKLVPAWFVLTSLIVASLACQTISPRPTAMPTLVPKPPATRAATATELEATATTVPDNTSTTVPTAVPLATLPEPTATQASLDDAQKAVIQIEAQGTFMDPKFGAVTESGRGSGFIIDPSGLAVTNNHVVSGAAMLKVWVGGDTQKTYNAHVVAVSECSDLAVIQIQGQDFSYLEWRQAAPKVGLDVYAAGFPLGDPRYTLTKGIVSKVEADGQAPWMSLPRVLEIDAKISPGNSGGPLLDTNGQVVGVNFALNQKTGQNFSIRGDDAQDIVKTLRDGQDIDTIGINGQAVQSDDGQLKGIWISSVKSGSPADKAQLKPGDIILRLENVDMAADGLMTDYCSVLRSHQAQDTLDITVLRYATGKCLGGQLNGRELAPEDCPSSAAGNAGGTSNGITQTVSNDQKTIEMVIPSDWKYDGADWVANWGDISFTASQIVASTDPSQFDVFKASSPVPGVVFAASRGLSKIGGYMQLMDDASYTWYESKCGSRQRYDYNDGVYEGKYDVWENCGTQKNQVWVIGTRPIDDPFAYLLLVRIYVTDKNDEAQKQMVDDVFNSFQVIDKANLP